MANCAKTAFPPLQTKAQKYVSKFGPPGKRAEDEQELNIQPWEVWSPAYEPPEKGALDPELLVNTTFGIVMGEWHKDKALYSFKGIPYAKPPVGRFRFRRPEPPRHWSGILDCTKYSAFQPQPPSSMTPAIGTEEQASEDSLYLNVFTPSKPAPPTGDRIRDGKAKPVPLLPVMVWLHAGGYQAGAASSPEVDGYLARRGVVQVSFNYRLNLLGMLKVSDGDWNCTFHDIIAALRFVKDNAKQFGGDPNNITLYGGSAGAHAALMLMASPIANTLFHKVIASSGFPQAMNTKEDSDQISKEFQRVLGLASFDTAALIDLSAKDLVTAYGSKDFQLDRLNNLSSCLAPPRNVVLKGSAVGKLAAVIDDEIWTRHPLELLRSGAANHIKLVIGHCQHESKVFLRYSLPDLPLEMQAMCMPGGRNSLVQMVIEEFSSVTSAEAEALVDAYQKQYPQAQWEELWIKITSDMFSGAGTLMVAERLVQNCPTTGNVYVYRFDGYGQLANTDAHGHDVPLFNSTPPKFLAPYSEQDVGEGGVYTWEAWFNLSEAMVVAWIAFATRGDPCHDGHPEWLPYTSRVGDIMVFDGKEPGLCMRPTRVAGPKCTFKAENMDGTRVTMHLTEQHFGLTPTENSFAYKTFTKDIKIT
ncbi:hypothetical protein CYMTET_55434 [Cymbomonas tetramitiformis]|uniref:Carboxylic ester hydrolase n=1 Tax=Cymbomonas tetramitiformis TaxID=36881 RepID=A0AAE0EPR6_9CHLO|nr:hypothetical protein CYMTET_55434 [Cymbomonas tetramitiformis]